MLKKTSAVFGLLFIATGILGFFPNPVISEVGLFHTDFTHNIVHLALGAILIFGAMQSDSAARESMFGVSIFYLALAIVGFFQFGGEDDMGMLLGITEANSADNWLHLGLALSVALGARIAGRNEKDKLPEN